MVDLQKCKSEIQALENDKRDLKQGASAGNKEKMFTDKLKKMQNEIG